MNSTKKFSVPFFHFFTVFHTETKNSTGMRWKGDKTAIATDGKKLVGEMLDNGFENCLESVDVLGARKPGVSPNMWTSEEDNALRMSVERHGDRNWREIAEDVPGRNHIQCVQRWKKVLAPGLVKGHWTREEDQSLMDLINQMVSVMGNINQVDWTWVSQNVPGRSVKQCRERWHLNLDPSINRNPWSAEEDRLLLCLVEQFGSAWAKVSKAIDGRTENSVKTRHQSLLRQQARVRGWLPEEDHVIVEESRRVGREWGFISKKLKGRTSAQVRKRFATLSHNNPDLLATVQEVESKLEMYPTKPKSVASNTSGSEGFDTDRMLEPSPAFIGMYNPAPASSTEPVDTWGIQSLIEEIHKANTVVPPNHASNYERNSLLQLGNNGSFQIGSNRSLQLDRVFSDDDITDAGAMFSNGAETQHIMTASTTLKSFQSSEWLPSRTSKTEFEGSYESMWQEKVDPRYNMYSNQEILNYI